MHAYQSINNEGAMMASPRPRTGWTLALVSAALFMVTLDNLVVTTALPRIRVDLGATLGALPRRQARRRARDMVGRQRSRRRARAGHRRRRGQRYLVALDLLDQRADRSRRRPARAGAAVGESRPQQASRPTRCRPR